MQKILFTVSVKSFFNGTLHFLLSTLFVLQTTQNELPLDSAGLCIVTEKKKGRKKKKKNNITFRNLHIVCCFQICKVSLTFPP